MEHVWRKPLRYDAMNKAVLHLVTIFWLKAFTPLFSQNQYLISPKPAVSVLLPVIVKIMLEKVKLSIIIPTKNEGKYIGQTIGQFEAYLEKYNLEIIISDADSRDETAAEVRHWQEKCGERIKFVPGPAKQNIAIGRNLGAAQATGELLFHSDADVRIPDKDRFFQTVFSKFEDRDIVAATVPIWVYPEESGLPDLLYHILMNSVIRLSFMVGVYLAKGECQLVRRTVAGGIRHHVRPCRQTLHQIIHIAFRQIAQCSKAFIGVMCLFIILEG